MKIKMNKKEKELLKELVIGTSDVMVTNPYSKESYLLTPEAAAVYDFLKTQEYFLYVDGEALAAASAWDIIERIRDKFYAARDVFIKNWPQHYSTLID